MEIETYRNHNTKATYEESPLDIIKVALFGTNLVMEFVEEINPKIREDYALALKKNLQDEANEYQYNLEIFDLDSLKKDLTILKEYNDIPELIIQVICKHMNPTKEYHPDRGKYELFLLDWLKAYLLWRYFRTKSFVDVLGREEGITFWKKIAVKLADYGLENSEEGKPVKEVAEGWKKYGSETPDNTLMDFTVVKFDEHKVLVKFDSCGVHEVLKYLNDPELTYLSYCYVGDVEDERSTKIRRRRRSQVLHLGEFCDEFFWNNEVHPDAKQPPLEFMRKLGKEEPEKIVKEYQGKV
ncbi:MAG: hypothetical protein GPJ52_06615 [Candidatus Heimdallarchaeota archaeon]|nr:hypothetical protein [Candidatus Heimdallarchaeota archaeon]